MEISTKKTSHTRLSFVTQFKLTSGKNALNFPWNMKWSHEIQVEEQGEFGIKMELESHLVFEKYFSKFNQITSIYRWCKHDYRLEIEFCCILAKKKKISHGFVLTLSPGKC